MCFTKSTATDFNGCLIIASTVHATILADYAMTEIAPPIKAKAHALGRLSVIVLFLAVQFYVGLHQAKYLFPEHEHAGEICDIYLLSSESEALTGSASAVWLCLSFDHWAFPPENAVARAGYAPVDGRIRAPPAVIS
jgi:hypothetical protein